MLNLGPFPFAIFVYILLWIFVGIGFLIMKRKTPFKRFMLRVKKYMTYSALYRLFILVYFQLSLMCCYQLMNYNENAKGSYFTAFFFLILLLLLPKYF